jgi:type IV secretion system protein VirB9
MVWGVRFIYPERVKEAQAAAWVKQKAASDATAKDLAALAHPVSSYPMADANVRYGYRGSVKLQPDHVWDDGRSTYLRYDGNRQLPNVYSLLPDGKTKSIPATSTAPDEHGNTITIAGTGTNWYLWYGEGQEGAGCLFDLGPDPDGRTTATIAQQQTVPRTPAGQAVR